MRLKSQNADVGEYSSIEPLSSRKHPGTSCAEQKIGVRHEVAASSTPNQRMPMSRVTSGRACATNQNPVCWVAVARSLTYFTPSTSNSIGRQR